MADNFLQKVGRALQSTGRRLLSSEQAGPVSTMVRNPYGSHPAAGLTPDRLAQILRSSVLGYPQLYLELAEDMEERFPQYGSVISTRKRQVSRLEFSVVPAGEEQADKDEAALVEHVIKSGAFRISKIDQLDAIGKGFSCVEMTWGEVDGQWLPISFDYRDPRFFRFDQIDPEHILLIRGAQLEELIPYKWLVHRAKAKSGLTVRGGLARQVAFLFLFASFNMKDWAIFAEAYGQPIRVGKYDPGASDEDKNNLLKALVNIGTDYAGIIPMASQIEFIKAEIAGSTDLYERRDAALDGKVSKIVLGQVGTTDAMKGGGYALGKVHNDVREDIQDADAEQWAATLNEQLVAPLIMFNFADRKRKGLPEIVIGRPEEEDVKSLVENVKSLVPFGLKVSMAEMQKKIGVTPPKNDEELLVAPRPPALAPDAVPGPNETDPPPPGKLPPKAVAASLHAHSPDAIDVALGDLLGGDNWEPLIEHLGADLSRRLEAAETAEQARSILAASFADLGLDGLTEKLAQAMFVARLAGETGEALD